MKLISRINKKFLFAVLLIILGILFRTVWHVGPNVEFVTAAALLSGRYLGRKWAVAVPLAIMALTDLVIGTTYIFLFTWSAYIVIGLLASQLLNVNCQLSNVKCVLYASSLGVGASIWFYLFTNFGVWFLDDWGMYSPTFKGLIDAYIMGIPFLRYNIIGNLVFVPSFFLAVEYVISISSQRLKKEESFTLP